MKYIALLSLLLVPAITSAQSIQSYMSSIVQFMFTAIVPFMLGIAFLFVVINIVRFFVADSANAEGRENAKRYIIYSILAFILIIVFWGIIILLATATNLDGTTPVIPDVPNYPATGGAATPSPGNTGLPSGPGVFPSP